MLISRRERVVSAFGALGVLLLIAVAMLLFGVPRRLPNPERSMALFDVSAPRTAPAPKPRPKEAVAVEVPPVVLPEPAKSLAALPLAPQVVSLLREASEQAGACDLTAPVQAALQADSAVADAVKLLPRDARSVANAVMVWNETWFPSDGTDADALTAVRHAIVATVDAASPECRNANQTGPRFLTLGDADATVFALGAEEWRWQDVVNTAAIQVSTAPKSALGAGDVPRLSRHLKNNVDL